jgi:hypothetical protein
VSLPDDIKALRWLADELDGGNDEISAPLLRRCAQLLEDGTRPADGLTDELTIVVGYLFGSGQGFMGRSVINAIERLYGDRYGGFEVFAALRSSGRSSDHDRAENTGGNL